MFFGGMFFGWAKPVPVNFGRLKHPKKDMLWVAAAGPGANFLMMVLWVISLKFSFLLPEMYVQPFELMCASGMLTNIVLMVLNLIPIPPLDGGRIAVSLLPYKAALRYARVERYGFIILIVLLFTHILDKIMWPFVMLTIQAIVSVFF
jgi:Zn-dependent protease